MSLKSGVNIERIDSLRSLTPYTIGISRGFANTGECDDDFNTGLVSMHADDSLQKILRQYLNRS